MVAKYTFENERDTLRFVTSISPRIDSAVFVYRSVEVACRSKSACASIDTFCGNSQSSYHSVWFQKASMNTGIAEHDSKVTTLINVFTVQPNDQYSNYLNIGILNQLSMTLRRKINEHIGAADAMYWTLTLMNDINQ